MPRLSWISYEKVISKISKEIVHLKMNTRGKVNTSFRVTPSRIKGRKGNPFTGLEGLKKTLGTPD